MPRSSILWFLTILALPVVTLIGDQTARQEGTADSTSQVTANSPAVSDDLSWMPKAETGALRFLESNPEADGRGTIVAIFDTGVDPGAAGLQTTPDGRPKIIDLVDGTGSGDVTMKKPVKAEEGELTGLTGRTLKLDPNWKNPSGEYRLGMKIGYELFPSELVEVVRKEREKEFRKTQAEHKAQLQRQLVDWKAAHPKPDDAQKKELKEFEAQIKLLEELLGDYSDPGPIYDCLVFNDGEHFWTVIDTDEDGDLADEKLLTNFRAERGFATFADPINLNFAVNIYEAGELLSIVADTGAHGTHVAGIVAAYYPDQPEWNGVAPGAQIVSVKIGDTRLDGMENGPGLARGLSAVLENHCDLINMSYGEPTSTPNEGRIADLYSQIVNEHGVIFVSSAGNAGPALTTVGAPGGTTSALIGVGAYVSPEMARSEYSLREKLPGLPYTWTSRGPTADGDLGVDIFAPGGAIAPVPQWTRQASQQMNGTSMASPNACGNIALLLSAAKQKKLTYTPHSVRKAIQNTAQQLPGISAFTAGHGLIQIDKAWDYLTAQAGSYAEQLNYEVRVATLNNARGIYLRERAQTLKPVSHRITVAASLKEKAAINERLDLSFSLNLKSTAEWLTSGDLLHLTHGGNRFEVEVDPTQLAPGAHYAEVQAFDRSRPESGPLFRLPVTVIIPVAESKTIAETGRLERTEKFEPGVVHRNFLQVPEGATWCELKMTLVNTDDQKFFRVHTMQLIEGEHFEHQESGSYYPLSPNVETLHAFPVVPGRMLEVDLAQYWSILGNSQVKYEIQFHGAQPDSQQLILATGGGVTPITLRNLLADEAIAPKGSLTIWRRTLLPKKHEITVLHRDRNQAPDGSSVSELTLDYTLTMASDGEVTLRLLPLEDLLYDAPVGPFVSHIFDKNGQRLTSNDMFPDAFDLKKGTYTVQVVIQHHDPALLEKFQEIPLTIDQPLSSPVPLKLWRSAAAAAGQKSGAVGGLLKQNQSTTFFLGEPALSALPKTLSPGDRLLGTITYSSDDHAAAKYAVEYVYAKPASSSSTSSNSSDDKDSLDQQIVALKLKHLKTLDPTSEDFKELYEELRMSAPENREPLIVRLELLDSDDKRKTRLPAVIAAADELIALYDQNQIAATLGKRVPEGDEAAKKAHEEAEEQKKELVDALYRKARAVAYRELPDVIAETPIADQAEQDKQFAEALKALEVWADLAESDYYLLKVREARRNKQYAIAIQTLNKELDADSDLRLYKKRLDMLGELGWKDWQNWQQQQMLLKFPKQQPPYK